jgi:hypothetical protein
MELRSLTPVLCGFLLMSEFDEWLLAELWHPMLHLEPAYRAFRGIWAQLVGRHVQNQVAFELYAHAVNGWMLHASDFGAHLLRTLERIKQDHRQEFKRNRWRDIRSRPDRINLIANEALGNLDDIRQRIAIDSANREREDYKKLWDHYFPTSKDRGLPSHGDIDRLKNRLTRIGRPIRDHRNTVSAHPTAPIRRPAAWRHVRRAFVAQRTVVETLYFLRTRGSLLSDLPTANTEADLAAAVLSELIVGAA